MNFLFKPLPNWIIRILKILSVILSIAILLLFAIWLIGVLVIFAHDKKENKNSAEHFYREQSKKYETSGGEVFKMDYVYDVKTNTGFLSGGGFIENGCWERYIIEAWVDEEIASISLCEDEKITKEKLETLNNFWKKYDKIFRSKDKIRNNYFKEYINSILKNSD